MKMHPDNFVIKSGLPEKAKTYALIEPGRQYAIYVFGGPQAELGVDLPAGSYKVEWISPLSGTVLKQANLKHDGGVATLNSPRYDPDVALRVLSSGAR